MLPCVNPLGGEPLTGEPDAGDPHVRFGGRGNESNRLPLPLYRSGRASIEDRHFDVGSLIQAETCRASEWQTSNLV